MPHHLGPRKSWHCLLGTFVLVVAVFSECLKDYIFGEGTGGPRLSLKGMELCVGTLGILYERRGEKGKMGESKG